MHRFVFLFSVFFCPVFSFEALYLTYPADPSTSVAIHWIDEQEKGVCEITYRSMLEEAWHVQKAEISSVGKFSLKRSVLFGLKPDTEYVFQVEEKKFFFQTLSLDQDKPVFVAIGGDAYQNKVGCQRMNSQVARCSPDFVILGGDIAYAGHSRDPIGKWIAFFKGWYETMYTKEGKMIPLVGAIGNHDLSKKQTFFCDFFPYLEGKTYGKISIGDRVSFILLDTGHAAPIAGNQASWLAGALQEDSRLYKIAVYHIGAYPSVYPYDGAVPSLIRKTWCPLFEQHRLILAFENHNHAFKRTHPMKEERIDKEGVVYIGDGAWGVVSRYSWGRRPYLANNQKSSCCSFLTITKEGIVVETKNAEGKVIDQWTKEK